MLEPLDEPRHERLVRGRARHLGCAVAQQPLDDHRGGGREGEATQGPGLQQDVFITAVQEDQVGACEGRSVSLWPE